MSYLSTNPDIVPTYWYRSKNDWVRWCTILHEVCAQLAEDPRANIVLVGPPRSGKSAMIQVLEDELDDLEYSVYQDGQDMDTMNKDIERGHAFITAYRSLNVPNSVEFIL